MRTHAFFFCKPPHIVYYVLKFHAFVLIKHVSYNFKPLWKKITNQNYAGNEDPDQSVHYRVCSVFDALYLTQIWIVQSNSYRT